MAALEELMVTSSRRRRGKVSLGGVELSHCGCWSLIQLQEEQMQKGARTIAEHRSDALWGPGWQLCCWRTWGLTSCSDELEHLVSAAESRVALLWGEGGKGFNQCSAVVARLECVCVIVKIQCMERPGGSQVSPVMLALGNWSE